MIQAYLSFKEANSQEDETESEQTGSMQNSASAGSMSESWAQQAHPNKHNL